MSNDVELVCRCGSVHGWVKGGAKSAGGRVVCYCDDCQAFAHQLGRSDILDPHGGTDVVPVAPAALCFDRGADYVACLRLSPKGLYRWYTTCCNTPVGNALTPAIPYVGVPSQVFPDRTALFGAPIGAIQGKYAVGSPPPRSTGLNLDLVLLILKTMWKVLGWKLGGKSWPHPFFQRKTGQVNGQVTVLSREEREALRPLCGPRPA